ncbi:MAG TPA: hypothetical protein VGB50_04540 [Flavobacterium sp.]|jgi:hypothetical protein
MENNDNNVSDRAIAERYKDIPGWGIDADPKNNPTYPMKKYTGADHDRLNYEKPPQQTINIELLKSIERPQPSHVFGTSTPPSGLSGVIRRFAFKYSESTYAHWVPLVLADRINVIEGILDDLKHGIIPNIFAEKGMKADWKHNRPAMVRNVVIGVIAITALTYFLTRKNRREENWEAWPEGMME